MILLVCTGNVCRSPFAERWLIDAFARSGLSIPVQSAGTRALVGQPIDPVTAAAALDRGLDTEGHVARQLDRDVVAGATLVLTASRLHRRAVVELHPAAVQYTFALRQLGRILGSTGPRAASTATAHDDPVIMVRRLVVARRGRSPVGGTDADDVVDPRGRPREVHERAIEQMLPSLLLLAEVLASGHLGDASTDASRDGILPSREERREA